MKAPAWRRWVPRVLLVVGALLTIVACLGVWANRQLLNTDNWVDTSSALLRDPAVQTATAAYLADQVASNVTADDLRTKLPDRLKPFAPQAASVLSELADRVAKRALQSGAFQTIWKETNRNAHEQFIKLIEGDKRTVRGASVVLDLRPMLGKLATRIGLGPDFAAKLSGDEGRVQIVQESDIELAAQLRQVAEERRLVGRVPGDPDARLGGQPVCPRAPPQHADDASASPSRAWRSSCWSCAASRATS